jgi:hypothetical protein
MTEGGIVNAVTLKSLIGDEYIGAYPTTGQAAAAGKKALLEGYAIRSADFGKAVPLVGALVGGTFDGVTTNIIGNVAKKMFLKESTSTKKQKSKKGMFKIIVHDLIFPFSFYQLSSEYNTLSCTFTDTTAHTKTATLTLTAGNYTVVSILTALSTALTTICQTSSGSFIGFTPTFNFTYSTTTNKTTLQMTAPASASIVLPFQNNLVMGGFFGHSTSQTISTISTPIGTKISVANPVNQLLLRSGNLKQFQNREWYVQKDTFADILFRMIEHSKQMRNNIEVDNFSPVSN